MAQADYQIADQPGASFLSELNAHLQAIVTQNSGATEPVPTYPYQWWADTTSGKLKLRNGSNTAWVEVGSLADPNLGLALKGAISASGLTQSTGKLLGRTTAGSGAVEEITAGSGLSLSGGTIAVAGPITTSGLTQSTGKVLGRITAGTGAVEELTFSDVSGRHSVSTITSSSTLSASHIGNVVLVDTSAGAVTITLPNTGINPGAGIWLYHATGTAAVTLSRSGTDVLRVDAANSGVASYILEPQSRAFLVRQSGGWLVLSNQPRVLGNPTGGDKGAGTWNVQNGIYRNGALIETTLGYILLQDQKTSGTAGGSSAAGAWTTRELNTEVFDTGNDCTLSSNQFTLAAGTYEIFATAPAYNVGRHKLRLRNITDGVNQLVGSSGFASGSGTQTLSTLVGRFTIAAQKTFELQHYTQSGLAGQGLGVETSSGEIEIYASVLLRRIA